MSLQHSDYTPSGRFGAFTGRRFLFSLLAAFGIVFAANGLLIYNALSTFDGIEVDDAYQRGRAYNQTLEAMAAQVALGWHATVEVTEPPLSGSSLHAAHVVVTLADRAGRPLDGMKLHTTFWRPVSVGDDQSFLMRETAQGRYEGDAHLAFAGNWILRLAGIGPKGEKFAHEERVFIRN